MLIDSYEYQSLCVTGRLLIANDMTNDEMEEGDYTIYTNQVEEMELNCIHFKRVANLKAIADWLEGKPNPFGVIEELEL